MSGLLHSCATLCEMINRIFLALNIYKKVCIWFSDKKKSFPKVSSPRRSITGYEKTNIFFDKHTFPTKDIFLNLWKKRMIKKCTFLKVKKIFLCSTIHKKNTPKMNFWIYFVVGGCKGFSFIYENFFFFLFHINSIFTLLRSVLTMELLSQKHHFFLDFFTIFTQHWP